MRRAGRRVSSNGGERRWRRTFEPAADMERRSEELGASWAIAPRPADGYITLELGSHDSREFADEFISTILAAHNLE